MGTTTSRRRRPRQWKPGQKVEYTRTGIRPELSVHRPGARRDRSVLAVDAAAAAAGATEATRRAYEVGASSCCRSPRTSSSFTRTAGTRRVSADNPTIEWQWTKKDATSPFRNPKKDATFYLEFTTRGPTSSLRRSRSTIRSAIRRSATFAADSKDRKLVTTFPIRGAARHGDMAEICARGRSDLRARRRRHPASSASASSTPSSSPSSTARVGVPEPRDPG